jgi:hypothetical protein
LRRALAAALAAAFVAGCSGGGGEPLSKSTYLKTVASILLADSGPARRVRIPPPTLRGNDTYMILVSSIELPSPETAEREARDLAGLLPPKEVAVAQHDLIAGLRSYAVHFLSLERRLQHVLSFRELRSTLCESFRQLTRARQEFAQVGYEVRSPATDRQLCVFRSG